MIPRLLEHLSKKGKQREHTGAAAVRASSAGKCPRELAQHVYAPELAEGTPATALARFEVGHRIEASLVSMLKAAGVQVTGEQEEVETILPLTPEERARVNPIFKSRLRPEGFVIPGHIDFRDEDGTPVSVKSLAAYPFKLAAGQIEPKPGESWLSSGYMAQSHVYMKGLGMRRERFIGWCIERDEEAERFATYPFVERVLKWDDLEWERVERNLKAVLFSAADSIPPMPYGPVPERVWTSGRNGKPGYYKETGRTVVPLFPCCYCAFRARCYPEAVHDPAARKKNTYVLPEGHE